MTDVSGSLYCDVNKDGVVDIGDAAYIASALVQLPGFTIPSIEMADINGDEIIDIGDAAYIASALVQLPGFTIPEKYIQVSNNLLIEKQYSSEINDHIVNKLSWKFSSDDISQNHIYLLTTMYSKKNGDLVFYNNLNNNNVNTVPNSHLDESTHVSQGDSNASLLLNGVRDFPEVINLNEIEGLILYRPGYLLEENKKISFAQLTLSNQSNGQIEVQYGSSSHDFYQVHLLNVRNGDISF